MHQSKVVSPSKRLISNLNDVVEQTYHYEKTHYDLTQKIARNKLQLKKHLGRTDSMNVKIDDGSEFIVKRETDIKLEFFTDKLRKALDKNTFEQATDKRVLISDLDGLISVLKSYGVKPKDFKKFLTVEHEVNTEKLDHLIEIEEISVEDIQGCYKADFEEEIKIRKVK